MFDMLTTYRRHSASCPHAHKGRDHRTCKCTIWVQGTLEREPIRESLHTNVWARAQAIVHEWEATGRRSEKLISIPDACKAFLDDCADRGLSQSSVDTYGKLTKKLEAFCEKRVIPSPVKLDLDLLSQFRSTWSKGNWTSLKKWEQLRCLCKFWLARGWIDTDPSAELKRPIAKQLPTLPFTREEVAKILEAVDKYPPDKHDRLNRERIRAFVLTLRFTGLRMSDTWSLHVDRVRDGKVMLYTAKTGVPVWLPLPTQLLSVLGKIDPNGLGYYFWSGTSDSHAAYNSWQRRLSRLFQIAEVENAHPHRFRDTFAVELLLAGVPMDRVSILLGHQSIRVTERHYSPWVRARQDQLEQDVQRVWNSMQQ